jgi:hypothetical protein
LRTETAGQVLAIEAQAAALEAQAAALEAHTQARRLEQPPAAMAGASSSLSVRRRQKPAHQQWSRFRGVTLGNGKWRATIYRSAEGKSRYLGSFDDEELAAR